MDHRAFTIGLEFWSGDRQWRCTDVGSRVVIAIRIDSAEIVSIRAGERTMDILSRFRAERAGWFDGPPYAVAECVFDEDDLEGCSLDRDGA